MRELIIEGSITSGMGEGAFFMSMPHYKNEIKKKLGFDAFAGTLNMKIDAKKHSIFENLKPFIIEGFVKENKKFGGAKCYLSSLGNIDGAIIIPDINKHGNDTIEFIAQGV